MYIERNDIALIFNDSRLADLTALDGGSEPDEDRIEIILEEVNNLIDDSLRGKYSVPIIPAPPALKGIARILTKYKLVQLHDAISEDLQREYENNLALLRDYANARGKTLDTGDTESRPTYIKTNTRTGLMTAGAIGNILL